MVSLLDPFDLIRAWFQSFNAGDLINVTLRIRNTKERRYVAITDPLPAGTEPVDAWFATKDWPAWSPLLEKTGIAFGVVATLDDVPHDVQMRASGALVPIDDPRAGASLTVTLLDEDDKPVTVTHFTAERVTVSVL